MTTQSDHDARTPEERLLSKKRLGSFYLDDVRAIINRAEAAEAEVQRLREEREGYALLAEDEAVRGEYHAEGLDERGIYGGKSHEPIEERPVDRRHPDYADDPWLAEDTPKGGAA